jgi:hypothetical protein
MKNFKLRLIRSLLFHAIEVFAAAPAEFVKAAGQVLLDVVAAFDGELAKDEQDRADLWALEQRVRQLEGKRKS